MKKEKKFTRFWAAVFCEFLLISTLTIVMPVWANTQALHFNAYHSPTEVNKYLETIPGANEKITKLHKIAVSPGKQTLYLLEIGPEINGTTKKLPSVLVVANMNGTVPIATEAALYLAGLLLEKPGLTKDLTWYILPIGNPDAAARYFQKPLVQDARNSRPYNDDMDDRTDEDGVEDIDGNGIITAMRVKDPGGQWLPMPGMPELIKKADWSKGEKGIYTIYSEGIDNDGDGQYNEDGPGGVNVGITFPHLFEFFTPTGGPWALSTNESYNLVKFIVERPEIAMTFCFGESNFCLAPQQSSRKGEVDFSQITIPEDIAQEHKLDTNRTYTMTELLEIARKRMPAGSEINEDIIISFLGLGQVVNPLSEDLKFYNEISSQYREFLKTNKLDGKRLEPTEAKDGSFELWSYYQLGLPSFALDFWTPPDLQNEKAEIEPGKNKEVQGNADPREKLLLNFSTQNLGGSGFVPWQKYKHPNLGEVEIGGFIPYISNTPPAGILENQLKAQVPWLFELVKKRAAVHIAGIDAKSLGGGLYRVKVWVENTGYLPYPTAMGKRNKRILPVVVSLHHKNNFKIIAGKRRSLIDYIPGHGSKMVQWILQAEGDNSPAPSVSLEVITPNAGCEHREILLENTIPVNGGNQ
ncbi:MAG: hypothetical protein MUF15_08755 [Acidobacteria bacterium]|jgi:hypothetical protein|nr:hypothetical protein [Acidobacteriota bacterium]